jgi:hypothetical protein
MGTLDPPRRAPEPAEKAKHPTPRNESAAEPALKNNNPQNRIERPRMKPECCPQSDLLFRVFGGDLPRS